MKHPYTIQCDCKRCVREFERRTKQSVEAAKSRMRQNKKAAVGRTENKIASLAEQHGRYIDSGPLAWDDRESGPDY